MNFRVKKLPVSGNYVLCFGAGSELRFDSLGLVVELTLDRADRQFQYSAQRIARGAAARARLEMGRPQYGRANSETRLKFLSRVARLANDAEV